MLQVKEHHFERKGVTEDGIAYFIDFIMHLL